MKVQFVIEGHAAIYPSADEAHAALSAMKVRALEWDDLTGSTLEAAKEFVRAIAREHGRAVPQREAHAAMTTIPTDEWYPLRAKLTAQFGIDLLESWSPAGRLVSDIYCNAFNGSRA